MTRDKNDCKIAFIVWLIAGYCFLAPLDGLFAGSIGSIQRYYSYILIAGYILYSKGKIAIGKYSAPFFYLLFLYYFSLIWSIDKGFTFTRNNAYALLTIVYIICSLCNYNPKERKLIEYSIMIGSLLVLVYLFTTLDATNFFRGRLLLNEETDANGFAARMILPAYLFFMYFLRNERMIYRLYCLLASIVFVVIGLLTGSRGFLIAMLFSVFVIMLQVPLKRKILTIFGVVILLTVIYFVMIRFMPTNIYDRLFSLTQYSGHADTNNRVEFWTGGLTMLIKDCAFLGYGSGNDILKIGQAVGVYTVAHNLYVTMLMEYGILGLPVFLYAIKAIFWNLLNYNERIPISALSAMLVCVLFLSSYAKRFFWLVLIYSVIVGKNRDGMNEYSAERVRQNRTN